MYKNLSMLTARWYICSKCTTSCGRVLATQKPCYKRGQSHTGQGFPATQSCVRIEPKRAISVQQVADVFSLFQTNATRDIKRLLGKDSQLSKVASELNPNPTSVLTLEQFEKVVFELSLKGNLAAIA